MPAKTSQLGYDFYNNPPFETSVRGSTGDEVLTGDDQGDVFTAGTGDDTMIGGAGDDLFRDGPGADTISGGGGFDRLSFAYYAPSATSGVVADLMTQTVYNDGHGNTEHLSGIESLGAGTLYPDLFIGDNGANWLWGDKGDFLFGMGGDDAISFGAAPAWIDGGSGVNTIVAQGFRLALSADGQHVLNDFATHGVTVNLAMHMIVDDGFGGSGPVFDIQNVYGGPLDDKLTGDSGDNVLLGGAGNDILTGGGGRDVFLFNADAFDLNGVQTNGNDVITDFHHGLDKIDFATDSVKSLADLHIALNAHDDVVITYGDNSDTVTLLNVHHVTAQDFLFGPV